MRQPVVLTPRGVVRCAYCRTDDFSIAALGETRLHEGHVGVRFGDAALGGWTVLYEGEDVTDRCVEAVAGTGDAGLVYLYDGEWTQDLGESEPKFVKVTCSNSLANGDGHALVAQHRGNVSVRRAAS
jgi:hypothetical protein